VAACRAGAGSLGIKYDPVPYRPTILQKYYYFQQLSKTFALGSVFRLSLSSLDGEMDYAYGKKPFLNAAAAKNSNGTWGIGLSNYTSATFQNGDDLKDFALHNSGYPAVPIRATIHMPELAKVKSLWFAVHYSTATVGNQPNGFVMMHNSVVTILIQPLELVTLVSVVSPCPSLVK
jgi:hypothetical protein